MAKDGAFFGWETDLKGFTEGNPFRIDPLKYASDETLESICVKTADIGNKLGAMGEVAEYYRQKFADAEKQHRRVYKMTLIAVKEAGNAQQQNAAAERSEAVIEKEDTKDKAEALFKMAQVAQKALEIQFTALRKIGALRQESARNFPEAD